MNNIVESMMLVAGELIAFARAKNCELETLCHNSIFCNDRGYISFSRKHNRTEYALAGRVRQLPKSFQNSASAFRGHYHEGGSVESIEAAFELIKAWLLDGKEVDELPARNVRSEGIG